jgi:hypothetical protein
MRRVNGTCAPANHDSELGKAVWTEKKLCQTRRLQSSRTTGTEQYVRLPLRGLHALPPGAEFNPSSAGSPWESSA